MSLTLSSPSFSNGESIPKKFTCDGPDLSPQLNCTEPPAGTKTFALLTDDPMHPSETGIIGQSGIFQRVCVHCPKESAKTHICPTDPGKA